MSDRDGIENTVEAFASLMRTKLHENDHKPHWREHKTNELYDMLGDEVSELNEALDGTAPMKIARECVDIANFAMMIADIAGGIDETIPAREAVTIEALQRTVLELQARVASENARRILVVSRHANERTGRQELVQKVAELEGQLAFAASQQKVLMGTSKYSENDD